MTAPVNVNLTLTAVEKARDAWGVPPAWVEVLAEVTDRLRSREAAGRRIGYSGSTVSQVINNKADKHDLGKIEAAVRGALMGETVDCPVLLEITRDQCLWEQDQPRSSASALRAEIYRECRRPCPHFRGRGGTDVA